jgi:hypothetical protein
MEHVKMPPDEQNEEQEPFDPMPGMLAAVDQLAAVAPLQAKAMYSIYSAYVEAGFDADQAFNVVMFFLGSSMFADVEEDEEQGE